MADLASGAVRQIANDDMRAITPTDDLKWAIGRVDAPYRGQISWGGSKADIYRLNLLTGERTLIEPGLSRTMGISPDGKWFLYLQQGTGLLLRDGDREEDRDRRRPRALSMPKTITTTRSPCTASPDSAPTASQRCSTTGTTCGHCRLPAASPVNVTKGVGAKQETRLRVAPMRPAGAGGGGGGRGGGAGGGADQAIDLTKPITLSAYGEYTKKTGYFSLAPGQAPQPLIWADKAIGAPIVAKNADRVIFTQQTFTEYPNYWVSTKEFGAPRQVTDADPDLLKQFAWGSKKLIDYTNSKGQRLQATLDAAGRLRARQAVPDARVLLRDHVEHAPQLPDSAVRRSAAHVDVREQWLSGAAAGRRL